MKLLIDQGAPAPLQKYLAGYAIDTLADKGWSEKDKGELLGLADRESQFGPRFRLQQKFGMESSGSLNSLFNSNAMSNRLFSRGGEGRWTAEAAFGMPVFKHRLRGEPSLGYSVSQLGREVSVGLQFEPLGNDSSDMRLNIKLDRQEGQISTPSHGVRLEFETNF